MTAPVPAFVELRALRKRYGEREVLRGLDLTVAPGETCGLLGRNGAGKTTTLECLLGLRRPDAGTLQVAGLEVQADPLRTRALIGAQLQGSLLQGAIHPRAALRLFAAFYRKAEDPEHLLARFGLREQALTRFDALSAGQRQRLLLALALVNRPRLLVLDEPTTGLDPVARRELHALIRERRAEGVTVLLSTHDLDEAEHLCDRLALLHEGRIVAHDTPPRLLAAAAVPARIELQTRQPLAAGQLAFPEIAAVQPTATGWSIATTEPTAALSRITAHLQATGNTLVDLRLHPPSLAEVFFKLTGQPWQSSEEVGP